MARVAPHTPVREALHEMARCRAGSAVVVGESGALAGVFTHGDFGRHFQSDPDLLEKPVGDVMTRNPISIPGDHMAAEVLQLLQRLIAECETRGYRQMIAVIGDSANAGSIGVHSRCGFQMIGTHPDVGFKFGRWLDTVMMQRALGEGATTLPAEP